ESLVANKKLHGVGSSHSQDESGCQGFGGDKLLRCNWRFVRLALKFLVNTLPAAYKVSLGIIKQQTHPFPTPMGQESRGTREIKRKIIVGRHLLPLILALF